MDSIDIKIADILQRDGRASATEISAQLGLSVSATNERLRRLVAAGTIRGFSAMLDPDQAGAALCAFVLVDMAYDGEEAACAALIACPEVQELHHISGAHSYMMKLRLADTAALQHFLQTRVKPLAAVTRTETMLSLQARKETPAMKLAPAREK